MPTNVEEVEDLQSKGNYEDLLKTTSTNAKYLHGPCVKRAFWIPSVFK
jgi:hypothetical protein